MEKKKSLKKTIINLIFFVVLIGITFFLVFKDQDVGNIWQIALSSKWQYILIAIIAMGFYVVLESFNVRRILRALREKTNIFSTIKYTLIGFFFSAITPAASGGQPMEIYYMHKDGIKVSHGTLTLLMHLCSLQFVTLIIGIISAIVNFEVLESGLIYLFLLGIFFNFMAFTLLIIGIFSKKLSALLVKIVGKILKIFRIKNAEAKQERIRKEFASYQRSAKFIKKHTWLMIKTIITTALQMLSYYSVPFWIYRALGFEACTLWQMLTLQATLYATVSCIPSPGSVGVTEGGFLGIFRNVYSGDVINSAMLLSRGINFYLLIIVSSVVVTVNTLREKKEEKVKAIEGKTISNENES